MLKISDTKSYLVLIGYLKNSSDAHTCGTGILVTKGQSCNVITCRHVIAEGLQGRLFAIPKPLKTKSPPGGYQVFWLHSPRYHPRDDATGTFDIAVTEILNVNRPVLDSIGIYPLDSSLIERNVNIADGLEVTAAGFPIDYANAELLKNNTEPLLPRMMNGRVLTLPIGNLTQHGFGTNLKEAFAAESASGSRSSEGMSGGIVITKDGGAVVGMVLGSGGVSVNTQGKSPQTINVVVFAGANRIAEVF